MSDPQRSPGIYSALLPATVMLIPSSASADGIDLVDYFTRINRGIGKEAGIWMVVLLSVVILFVNYGWNLLVIAAPAIKFEKLSRKQALVDTVWITALGQLADRTGAFLSFFIAIPLTWLISYIHPFPKDHGRPSMEPVGWALAISNLACSGIAIGLVVFLIGRKRWTIQKSKMLRYAGLAAILTNPVLFWWVSSTWLLALAETFKR